ncbi:putative amino acid permease 7 [Camellia lanceoleosa]|uniref:Amino acid permease 7 n=1 Tax=Camellia lanceoleosa TaxID=1840588 RepID=A0ACC0HE84_9ERIC|nr:putative amino acid permease 7 [Camellia lanceoleosa]
MGVVTEDHHQTPLLLQSSLALSPHDQPIHRTGNVWTAVAHIITGVIGSGVLSLAWCMAQLGWIGGSFSMLFFAFITLISAFLLSNCYRSPHPELGPTRNHSYLEAVHFNLAIQKSNCYKYGHEANCEYGDTYYMLIVGLAQIVISQIPNFHNMEWLSVVAATMSFIYSFIALALGLAKVIGMEYKKISQNETSMFCEISLCTWTFSFSINYQVQLHITNEEYQVNVIENCKNTPKDTLKSPPLENETMKRASTIAVCITTFFYLCCGGFGYAAFGDSSPGNLLTGFGFYEPYWLIDFANACIVLHLVGGYQVFSQPLFADLEGLIAEKFPNSRFINKNYILKVPPLPAFRLNLLRLCFRTTYVALTTGLAMLFPYFNQVVGVAGSLNFWPLVVFFPTQMYIVQKNIGPWTRKWIGNKDDSLWKNEIFLLWVLLLVVLLHVLPLSLLHRLLQLQQKELPLYLILGNASVAQPQAYALVGMAATLASVCSVPLTSVLLLFELTKDYRILLPLMVNTCLVSSICTRGISYRGRERGLLTCYPDTDLAIAKKLMEARGIKQLPVVKRGGEFQRERKHRIVAILYYDSIWNCLREEINHTCRSISREKTTIFRKWRWVEESAQHGRVE